MIEKFSEDMDMKRRDEFCGYRIFLFSRYISDHRSIAHQRICFRPLQFRYSILISVQNSVSTGNFVKIWR